MPKFVALLRGVNVSGSRPVPMARLVTALEKRTLLDVTTYKASGNVIFESSIGTPSSHAALISTAIKAEFGHEDVDVLLLRAAEAGKIARANPLLTRDGVVPTFLHVTFPFRKIAKSTFEQLSIPASEREIALLSGGVIYLYCPDGYGRTKLTNGWFEKALRVSCTTRNWNTVVAIADLASR